MIQSMARALKPRELFRPYSAHLKRSGQELFYRSKCGDDGLSSSAAYSFSAVKSIGNSVGTFLGSFLQGCKSVSRNIFSSLFRRPQRCFFHRTKVLSPFACRSIATVGDSVELSSVDSPPSMSDVASRIMQILDKEAVEEV